MAEIYKGDDDRVYLTKYGIGDIVRPFDLGYCYSRYYEAFQICGVDKTNYYLNDLGPLALNENWVIKDMLIIPYGMREFNVLCCIRNTRGKYLMIDENGLKKRNIKVNVDRLCQKEQVTLHVIS